MAFITIDNNKLLKNNKEIFLKGFGLGGWLIPEGYMLKFYTSCDRPRRIEKLIEDTCGKEYSTHFWKEYYNKYISEFDIKLIAEKGFNSIRIPFNSRILFDIEKDNKVTFNKSILEVLDRAITWCKKYGIYVILDMHGAPGGQTGQNIDDSINDHPDLFTNKLYQKQLIDMWKFLAIHYRAEEIIVGYDLLNEPLPNFFNQYNEMVLPLYREIIKEIRKIDINHIIILEGVHWASDFSIFNSLTKEEVKENKIMLQFHKYWNNPDQESLKEYIKYSNSLNTPLLMGEGGENNIDWYTIAFSMYERLNIHYSFWTYKKMDNHNSIISFNAPKNWDKVITYLETRTKEENLDYCVIFDNLLRNITEVKVNNDVINSLNRESPLTIPAEGFDNFTIKENHQSKVLFREETKVELVFEDNHIGKPNYQKMNGEKQSIEDKIFVKQYEKESLKYKIRIQQGLNTISIKLKGVGSFNLSYNNITTQNININSHNIIEKKLKITNKDTITNISINTVEGELYFDEIAFNKDNKKVKIITTTSFDDSFTTFEETKEFVEDINYEENNIVDLQPEIEKQKFKGFGGAFTESASYVFSKLSPTLQDDVLQLYFSEEGLNYKYGRVPIDSCDFSLTQYSEIENEENIDTFSLKYANKYIIPFLEKAYEINKNIKLILAPWSPPEYMKENNSRLNGGKLKKEYYEKWANYLVSYIKKIREKSFKVFAISSQNEPNAIQTWDSCIYSAEKEALFISKYLGPALKENNLEEVLIIGWDHNKDSAYNRCKSLHKNTEVKEYLKAIGFHWYSGDHFKQLEMIRKQYPSLLLISTENCIELTKTNNSHLQNAQKYAHEIIGDLKAGLDIFMDWNLLLDSKGGPNTVNNYCVAPIMANKKFSKININEEYYYLKHFNQLEDSIVIESSSYTKDIEILSTKKGSSINTILLNTSNEQKKCNIRYNNKILNIIIDKNSIITTNQIV